MKPINKLSTMALAVVALSLANVSYAFEISSVTDKIKKLELPKKFKVLVVIFFLVMAWNVHNWNKAGWSVTGKKETPPQQAQTQDLSSTTTPTTKDEPQGQGEPIQPNVLEHLTKDELIEYVKTREKHAKNELEKYKLQVEQERLSILMQYDNLQKQLLEHDKQIKDFYARLELYKRHLPRNYDIIQQDPNLQVRAVVRKGNKCNAYNAHGNLMSLTMDECTYYIQEAGRLHRGNGQTTDIKADPIPKVLSDNPNFGQGASTIPSTEPPPAPDTQPVTPQKQNP